MYQVSPNISFRVDENQRTQLNAIAEELQTAESVAFNNAREFVFSLLNAHIQLKDRCMQLEYELNTKLNAVNADVLDLNAELNTANAELNTPNADLNTDVLELNAELNTDHKQILIDAIGYPENPTDESLYSDLLAIITTPAEPTVEVEVIKEIEKPLSKGEILVHLSAQEFDTLDIISRYRVHKKLDPQRRTISSIIKKMVFNAGSLTNYHGEFETGFNNKRLKN